MYSIVRKFLVALIGIVGISFIFYYRDDLLTIKYMGLVATFFGLMAITGVVLTVRHIHVKLRR